MYEYKCEITRVVDGDTVDAEIDLGFDIVYNPVSDYTELIPQNHEHQIKTKKPEVN